MKILQGLSMTVILVALAACTAPPQGTGTERETLNAEVLELISAGQYDRAVDVATKALNVADWADKAPPRLWRLLAATLVVSAPNLWYTYAVVDRIQYHAPPGQTGWPVVIPCSALFRRLLLVKSVRNGVKVWFLRLPILILLPIVNLPGHQALGLQ